MEKMKIPCFFITVLLILPVCSFAQDLDLIVKQNGDSIVCRIENITDSLICFSMISMHHRTHTSIRTADVLSHETGVVKKGQYTFRPGTSLIASVNNARLPVNSVYVGLATLNYSRTMPVKKIWFTVGGGLIFMDDYGALVESTVLFGRNKKFLELGIRGFALFNLETMTIARDYEARNQREIGASIKIGYRYQGPKGFLFRAALHPGIAFDQWVVLPSLSLGYSFGGMK